MLEKVDWLGHASFRITTQFVIYVDPWKVRDEDKADLILITHSHDDHCSPDDVKKVMYDKTIIITVPDAKEKLKKAGVGCRIELISPGKKIHHKGVDVEAVPAYNIHESYHTKDNGWIGFIVDVLGERLYFAGDTDYIHEMKHLGNIDVAFLPVAGTYTMDVEGAVKAALVINPKYVVPMHYGDIIGSVDHANAFKALMEQKDPSIEVVIKQPDVYD